MSQRAENVGFFPNREKYYAGGEYYVQLQTQFGIATANQAAGAASTGQYDALQKILSNAKQSVRTGAPVTNGDYSDAGFWETLGGNLYNRPLQAPLEQLNQVAGNTIKSLIFNPFAGLIVVGVGVGAFYYFGGFKMLSKLGK